MSALALSFVLASGGTDSPEQGTSTGLQTTSLYNFFFRKVAVVCRSELCLKYTNPSAMHVKILFVMFSFPYAHAFAFVWLVGDGKVPHTTRLLHHGTHVCFE